jgi:hypothetical protein
MKGHSPQTKTPIFWKVLQMKEGFLINKGEYAAVPYGNSGYIVLHNGQQLEKVCRTEGSAKKYIADHKRGKSLAEIAL